METNNKLGYFLFGVLGTILISAFLYGFFIDTSNDCYQFEYIYDGGWYNHTLSHDNYIKKMDILAETNRQLINANISWKKVKCKE